MAQKSKNRRKTPEGLIILWMSGPFFSFLLLSPPRGQSSAKYHPGGNPARNDIQPYAGEMPDSNPGRQRMMTVLYATIDPPQPPCLGSSSPPPRPHAQPSFYNCALLCPMCRTSRTETSPARRAHGAFRRQLMYMSERRQCHQLCRRYCDPYHVLVLELVVQAFSADNLKPHLGSAPFSTTPAPRRDRPLRLRVLSSASSPESRLGGGG
jgi:hypothetical protein